MNILICAAHPNEIKNIKKGVKNLSIKDTKILFLQLGIGNSETIFNLTKYLENQKVDFIVNIGICGKRQDDEQLIQIGRIVNHYDKELIVPVVFEFAKIRSIICLDKQAKETVELNGEDYVDMESFGIEFVASKYNIPRIILKLPADKIGNPIDLDIIKNKANELSLINYNELISKIKDYLNKIPQVNYSYLLENYHFTFQEFEIMKFKINKYEAFTMLKFPDFYIQNKHLQKGEFLQNLENNFSFDRI